MKKIDMGIQTFVIDSTTGEKKTFTQSLKSMTMNSLSKHTMKMEIISIFMNQMKIFYAALVIAVLKN
ncbi:hypothetical protein AXJ14_gp192 [Geobacillus virus E3]|uniref:hypothetical protein n=1 Tax=Geobacillus virus E3 TaxID=1572712 RepID=UPI0006719F87|nr:hypothetical protein AXJ14_gp192 [Geobacillus virus E3]AJA41511.1 hypothetical protein E3_0192 [Geobacillus virus E3]